MDKPASYSDRHGDEHKLSIELLSIISALSAKPSPNLFTEESNVYTDFDLDSLKILELTEVIKDRFGVDLLTNPEAFRIMSTSKTLAKAILCIKAGSDAL